MTAADELADCVAVARSLVEAWECPGDEALRDFAMPAALLGAVLERIADGASQSPQVLAALALAEVGAVTREFADSPVGYAMELHTRRFSASANVPPLGNLDGSGSL